MKLYFFIAIGVMLIAGSNDMMAQEKAGISGIVWDESTRLPIENVDISIIGSSMVTKSNPSGTFGFSALNPGEYTLRFSHVSYQISEQFVQLRPREKKSLEIYLNKDIKDLDEIVVEEASVQQAISKMPYVVTPFTSAQIHQSNAADVGEFLRSSKNINGIRKGGTQIDPVLRGFKFSQLNVLLNSGQKIEGGCPNRMDPATAHTELENISRIDVIKGPYLFRYGPSFGGVIDLQTQVQTYTSDNPIHVHAQQSWESNWNGNKEFVGITGNYKWVYYNISAGLKKYGNYKDGNDNIVDSEFSKYNMGGKLGFKLAEHHTLLLSYQDANGRDVRFPALPMDERKDDTQLSSIDYATEDLPGIIKYAKVKMYHSKVRHEMDNKYRPFSDTVVAVSVIDAINMGGRIEAMFDVNGASLVAGIDYEHISKNGDRTKSMILQPGLPVKVEDLWNHAEINNNGFFTDYTKSVKGWEFIGALRFDLNRADSDSLIMKNPMQGEIYNYSDDSIKTSFTNFSVSLGTTKKINEKLSISLAAGRGVRSPDMTERFIILLPIGYDNFDYLGDPKLKPEANNQVDLTFKYSNPKIGQFQLNGFYSIVNNYITGKRLPPSVQKPLSKDVLGVKQFYNAGNARLRGFEISWLSPSTYKLEVAGFASWTYGTIDESLKYIVNDAGQVVDDVLLRNDAIAEIPPFEGTLDLNYKITNGKLIPRLKIRGVAAQNHISEANYEKSSPGFVLTTVSVTYKFLRYFTFSVGVNNLFDVAYYEHLNRNIIGSNMNLYEPGRSFYFNLFIDL